MDNVDTWKKANLIASGMTAEDAIQNSKIEVSAFTKPVCPRCGTMMTKVTLSDARRKAYFCATDNVVVPLPIEK